MRGGREVEADDAAAKAEERRAKRESAKPAAVEEKEQEAEELLSQQKDRLNWFLQETLRIEKLQIGTTDVNKLEKYLDEVTQIKLEALGELTEEDLRGNQAFSIFLDQCTGLRNKIQLKILSCQQG